MRHLNSRYYSGDRVAAAKAVAARCGERIDAENAARSTHYDTRRSRAQQAPFASLMFENPAAVGKLKVYELHAKPTPSTVVNTRIFISQSHATPTLAAKKKARKAGTHVFAEMDEVPPADTKKRKGRVLGTVVFKKSKRIVATQEEMTSDTILLDANLAEGSRVELGNLRKGFNLGIVKHAWPIHSPRKIKNPPLASQLRAGGAGAILLSKTAEKPRRRLPKLQR